MQSCNPYWATTNGDQTVSRDFRVGIQKHTRSLGNGVRKNGVRNRCPYRRCGVDTEIPYRLPFWREFCLFLPVRVAPGVDTEFPYRVRIVDRGVDCRDPFCRHRFRFLDILQNALQNPLLEAFQSRDWSGWCPIPLRNTQGVYEQRGLRGGEDLIIRGGGGPRKRFWGEVLRYVLPPPQFSTPFAAL